MWDAVVALGSAFWLLTLGWHVSTMAAALAQPRKRRVHRSISHPSVSVIVPVSSAAPALARCAASLAELDYPKVEVLLCAAEGDFAAAKAIVAAEQAQPGLRACVVKPAAIENPKSALLAAAIPIATHELLLLTDDNVVSSPLRIQDASRLSRSRIRPGVGLRAGRSDGEFLGGRRRRLHEWAFRAAAAGR